MNNAKKKNGKKKTKLGYGSAASNAASSGGQVADKTPKKYPRLTAFGTSEK